MCNFAIVNMSAAHMSTINYIFSKLHIFKICLIGPGQVMRVLPYRHGSDHRPLDIRIPILGNDRSEGSALFSDFFDE
jgi:hypothetical protein